MAIIVDKDGNVVTVENEPEEAHAMFPNLQEERDMVSVEHGTVEHGVIERKAWIFQQPEMSPEAEEE